jgi:KipI family sensor histidine kinase inhibitor
MIYERPVFRTLGDTALNIEFGDETSIPLNFRILGVDAAIHQSPPKGIIETNPQVRALGIVYDPLSVSRSYLIGALSEFIEAGSEVDKLASRRLTIPALYDDPWSSECAEAFGVRNNMDFIAEFNDMTVAQVIEAHAGCDYWVTGVGFVPGAFMSYAMDPKLRIGAPLYRTPRTWTHSRLLNFGGTTSTIYPMRVPGGGQLFGRTPLNIFEPEQKNAAFRDSPVLAKAGDRHRYIAIMRDEYDDIRAQVETGAYDYAIEEDTFDCDGYLAWLEEQGEPLEKHDPDATWDQTDSAIRGPA